MLITKEHHEVHIKEQNKNLQKEKDYFEKLKYNDLKKCPICGTPLINAIDSKTKKISKYLWKRNCKCLPEGFILSIG